MKTCYICGETKEMTSGFSKNKQRRDGYDNRCKTCRTRIESDRMANLPEEKREAYRAAWRKKNHRNKYNKYGIDTIGYDLLYKEQEGRCKICQEEFDLLMVDHCHASGKVRGLLCTNCNLALGHFKDNIERLERAIDYIGR